MKLTRKLFLLMLVFLCISETAAQRVRQSTKSMTGTVVSVDPGTWRWQAIIVKVGDKEYSVYTFSAEYAHPKIIGKVDEVGRTVQVFYTKIENGNEVFPTRIVEIKKTESPAKKAAANACRFCGTWEYDDRAAQMKWYLKITPAGRDRFRFIRGSVGVGNQIYWEDDDNNFPKIYLKAVNGKLKGSFVSHNFWTTGGAERTYKITCALKPNGKMSYTVTSQGFTERHEATKKN